MGLRVCLLSALALLVPCSHRASAPGRPTRPRAFSPLAWIAWDNPPPGGPGSQGSEQPPPLGEPEPSTLVLASIGGSLALSRAWWKYRQRQQAVAGA